LQIDKNGNVNVHLHQKKKTGLQKTIKGFFPTFIPLKLLLFPIGMHGENVCYAGRKNKIFGEKLSKREPAGVFLGVCSIFFM